MDQRSQKIQEIIESKFRKAAQEAAAEIEELLSTDPPPPNSQKDKKESADLQKIRTLCRQLGGDPSSAGFGPITYGIYLCWQDEKAIQSLKHKIYPKISDKYSLQMKSVPQLMAGAIQKMAENMDEEKKFEIFGNSIRKTGWNPTTGQFLASMKEYIVEKGVL